MDARTFIGEIMMTEEPLTTVRPRLRVCSPTGPSSLAARGCVMVGSVACHWTYSEDTRRCRR